MSIPQFKRARRLTLPNFKLIENTPLRVRFESVMVVGKRIDGDEADRKPATIANVTNLDTGELGQIVCPRLLVSELNETFPQDTYVGKSFEIVKGEKKKGKNNTYNTMDIFELEEVAPPDAQPAKIGKK